MTPTSCLGAGKFSVWREIWHLSICTPWFEWKCQSSKFAIDLYLLSEVVGQRTSYRVYPHYKKVVYLGKIFCHRQRLTSAKGLPRPNKFCPKQTNLPMHHQRNLLQVKLWQNWQNEQNGAKLVNHLSEKLLWPAWSEFNLPSEAVDFWILFGNSWWKGY